MLSYAVHADIAQQVCTDSLVHTSRVFEFGPLGVSESGGIYKP